MTVILGLRSGGVSYVAADSRYCSGNPIPTKAEKIVKAGRWVIGASGYARTGNVLQENTRLLASMEDIGRLCRELRRLLLDDGWQKRDEDGPQALGDMALIVADESATWFVGSDFSYHPLDDGRPWGTGSGSEYAEGSCAALLSVGWAPEAAMREAIRIAASYDPGTDDRIEIVQLGQAFSFSSLVEHKPTDKCSIVGAHQVGQCGKWVHLQA